MKHFWNNFITLIQFKNNSDNNEQKTKRKT